MDEKKPGTPTPAAYPIGHLIAGPDRRTPEERAEAERKEYARRKGRGAKNWWKKDLPPEKR